MAGSPIVGDIRGEGLMIGIELVKEKAGRVSFDPGLKVPARIVAAGYEEGILVRPLANLIAMSPPLTLSDDNVAELVGGLTKAFHTITDALTRDGSIAPSPL